MGSIRKNRRSRLEVTEVVKTVDLSPISMAEGEDEVRLRVEILRKAGNRARFTATVWRIEFYRVQPTFPQQDGRPASAGADEQILVIDDNFAQGISGPTANSVLKKVIREIEARFFGVKRG
jgi:hypothetical protein